MTVSDTRDERSDRSGRLTHTLVARAGNRVAGSVVVPDEPVRIRRAVANAVRSSSVDAVLVNGGTGFSRRDRTWEALRGLYDVEIPGFGELFRMLSFREIGPAAMLSRASAGLVRGRPVFSIPGSEAGVSLALRRLILPELGHFVHELTKQRRSR